MSEWKKDLWKSSTKRLKIKVNRQREGKSLRICLIEVLEGKNKENEEKSVDKDTMGDNFPELKKDRNPQIKESYWVTIRINK